MSSSLCVAPYPPSEFLLSSKDSSAAAERSQLALGFLCPSGNTQAGLSSCKSRFRSGMKSGSPARFRLDFLDDDLLLCGIFAQTAWAGSETAEAQLGPLLRARTT
jgi:hypothetical protein